jgi:acetoacetyl-CoA synthetase
MAKLLWKPSAERVRQTNMLRFMASVNQEYGQHIEDYPSLYDWSVNNNREFWASWWDFAGIMASAPFSQVIDDLSKMPGAKWFPGARLNFAENLLRYRDDRHAIIFHGEDQVRRQITFSQLYIEVARTAKALKNAGVQAGDRVAGFMPNMPETIIAMLAAASIGAIWSSCSPDFGIKGVLDRFGQIEPKILFTADSYFFKGKALDCLGRIADILKQLPSIQRLVVVPYAGKADAASKIQMAELFDDFKSKENSPEIDFLQLPFDHPLYVMYSSGTTGLPKCMVQSAGGILLNHLKELILHTDLKRDDTIFYFTTCGWMMWNWLTSSLAVGATVILYDGNPFHPDPGILWQIAQHEGINIFGTSAGYLTALQNTGLEPGKTFDLSALRTILSTGSPLSTDGFEYVYRSIKSDVQLSSISGGTDLNGCFALGNPMGPVYAGQLQCRGLGLNVEAFNEKGQPIINQQGELVCTAPFPSMPIYFWDDPEGEKYYHAYFNVYPNIWRHGDFIEITENGGVTIYGRSDATLNPGGVRIGTADIYRVVEKVDEVVDSIVIGQSWNNDIRIVLFVKLQGGVSLSDEIKNKIVTSIRSAASPRHVPAKIIAVPEIPYTLNMKKVELAVKKTVHGQPVTNKDALANPDVLEYFSNLDELKY